MLADLSLLKNRFASKIIWLNFYTMKFSRFKFSFCWTFNILTHSVNIVKCFFNFLRLTFPVFKACRFSTAWLFYQTFDSLSSPFFFFFITCPLPCGGKNKSKGLPFRDSLFILPPSPQTVKHFFLYLWIKGFLIKVESCLTFFRFCCNI